MNQRLPRKSKMNRTEPALNNYIDNAISSGKVKLLIHAKQIERNVSLQFNN